MENKQQFERMITFDEVSKILNRAQKDYDSILLTSPNRLLDLVRDEISKVAGYVPTRFVIDEQRVSTIDKVDGESRASSMVSDLLDSGYSVLVRPSTAKPMEDFFSIQEYTIDYWRKYK
jgi:hypothetical protein